MELVKKKKIVHNDKDYLISIKKTFDDNVNGTDYYRYHIKLYDGEINKGIKGIFFKNDLLLSYSTYWLRYYEYNGEIDLIIKEALRKHDFNTRENKYINSKENEWK